MSGPTSRVHVRAPAKINLLLRVGGPRPDGFHDLVTVFQAVSLYEDLAAEPDDDISVEVRGPWADRVPADESNLAVQAAHALARRTGVTAGARMTVDKQVPVAAGMAGGSADAAAALVACDALWQTGLSREELREVAAELGSDVPFALLGGTALGTGRGEQLTPVLTAGEQYHWVLALCDEQLSTPDVYTECDRLREGRSLPDLAVDETLMQALRSGDSRALGAHLVNDLQPAACRLLPELDRVLELGSDEGALGGLVSGSGPTVAFLVRDNEHALDLSVTLTASGAAHDVRRVQGPVPGTRLVEPVMCQEQ